MPVELRPVNVEIDYPRLAELISAVDPEPVTPEQLREWDSRDIEGRIHRRVAALDGSGRIIGFNETGRVPWMPTGRFWIGTIVDPGWRRQGMGAQLYAEAEQAARELGAQQLSAEVRDHTPEALHFAEQRGFTIDRHIFESTLDLATFDETPFAGAVEAAEAQGFRFFSLADLGNSEAAQRQLYELNRACALDIPGWEGDFAPWESFRQFVFGASWYRADGQLVAVHGETWAGLAALGYFETTNSMYNMMTGVARAYRGRGLAQALKVLAIRVARKYGAAYIRTNNDSKNAPMLAINRKLGYQPQPGVYRMLKGLG